MNCRYASASATLRPLTASVTNRTLRGGIPTPRAMARTSIVSTPYTATVSAHRGRSLVFAARMATKRPGRGELAQLVPHHIFRDEDGHMGFAIVHPNAHPHHL